MFDFFRNSSAKKSPSRRKPRKFRLEALECRVCPSAVSVHLQAQTADAHNVSVQGQVYGSESSYQIALSGPVSANLSAGSSGSFSYYGPASGLGTITATVTDTDGDTAQSGTSIVDNPPQVMNLNAVSTGTGKQVTISGSVSAGDVSGLTVTLSGSAGIAATSATTDSNGNFSLLTTASQVGNVSAYVTDVWGVTSSVVTTNLIVTQPQINGLTIEATGQGKQVDVSGTVAADAPGGLTVNFSGSAGLAATSATTDSNGNFSLQTTASQLGNVNAAVTDEWGNQASASGSLTVMAPQITGFTAVSLGNGEWQFSGTVPANATVQLSGLYSATVTPNASGYFSVVCYLGTNDPIGNEYAVATDVWGQTGSQAVYPFY
jgi:hypothetical protein